MSPTLVALVRAARLAHLWIKKGARHRRVGVAIRGSAIIGTGLYGKTCLPENAGNLAL